MEKQAEQRDEKFSSLRNEFDDLKIEEKAAFLVESGFSFLTHGIESVVQYIREEVDNMASGSKESSGGGTGVPEDSEFAKEIAEEDGSDNDGSDNDGEAQSDTQ